MKSTKRICSIILSVLLLIGMLPTNVYVANLKITTQPKTSYQLMVAQQRLLLKQQAAVKNIHGT